MFDVVGLIKRVFKRPRAEKIEPAAPIVIKQMDIDDFAARGIQRAWRRIRFYRRHGETRQERWMNIAYAIKEERRRERKLYIQRQKKELDYMKRLRAGGALREDWRYIKQPPGGVMAADPNLPLKRQVVWTNHDVALFVAVCWKVGVPEPSMFKNMDAQMKPYHDQLYPRHQKKDIRRMLMTLRQSGAIEDLKFLSYLDDDELDRLVPPWVADDVRKGR